MGRMSREKGARGEREVVALARTKGLEADRLAPLQAGRVPGAPDVLIRAWPELHVEVKRDERMSVDAMVRQSVAEAAAFPGDQRVPLVAWRRNGGQWRVDAPLDWCLDLLAELHHLRAKTGRAAAIRGIEPERHSTPTTKD